MNMYHDDDGVRLVDLPPGLLTVKCHRNEVNDDDVE